MVSNTGKTLCPDAFKPVNLPEAVRVEENPAGEPAVVWLGKRQMVKSLEDRWRLDDEWWRSQAISRMYYAIVCQTGQRVTVFKDLLQGDWWRQGTG